MPSTVEKHDQTQPRNVVAAPGRPGAKPHWSSGAKTAVGTAVSNSSRIWFTIGSGTLNEIYFPDIDKANTRSIRFLVTDGVSFFSDEETDASHEVSAIEEGVPGYVIDSCCKQQRYRIRKEIVTDPVRDTLLMRVRFEAAESLHLYLLIDPQLADQGYGNNAWIGEYKEIPCLLANHSDAALAAICSVPFVQTTCGFSGKSDGLSDLRENCRLTRLYNSACNGNVVLIAELDWQASGGDFVVSLAFGEQPAEAAQQARAGLLQPFEHVRSLFVEEWRRNQQIYRDIPSPASQSVDLYRSSLAVLQTHESKCFPGGFVASLSIPWGFARSDENIGGYHVLWPRDLAETAMGKLASGDVAAARRALFFLACTQEHGGNWSQNMWLDGTVHWGAEQMDGIAMPILLAERLHRENALAGFDAWPMLSKAARFLVLNGPATQQGRWEAVGGFSVFTMACEVAALLAAAEFADRAGETATAEFLRETADAWNEAIEEYTYVEGTGLAQRNGVAGYYMRVAPLTALENRSPNTLRVRLPNHMLGNKLHLAVDIVSPDALALVRYGLRDANDPRIRDTVRLLDATLRHEMTTGPGWRRSTHDGYGEHSNGAPFNGRGIGRCWPLLAGERGHYEVAASNIAEAQRLLDTMARQSSECGMIPEQVWDDVDMPERQLHNGRPTGSGMPLAWAHAEYVKLRRSINEKRVWDTPPQTVQRYMVERRSSSLQIWSEREPREWITRGKRLRVDLTSTGRVSWRFDDGPQRHAETHCVMDRIHTVTLPLSDDCRWKALHLSLEQEGGDRNVVLHAR